MATAMETSTEVMLDLNSTKLSEEFVITMNAADREISDDLMHLEVSDFGVEAKMVAKCVLSYNYRGIHLKMLSMYKYD